MLHQHLYGVTTAPLPPQPYSAITAAGVGLQQFASPHGGDSDSVIVTSAYNPVAVGESYSVFRVHDVDESSGGAAAAAEGGVDYSGGEGDAGKSRKVLLESCGEWSLPPPPPDQQVLGSL